MRGAVALGQEPVPAHRPLAAAQPLGTFLAREEGSAAVGCEVAEGNSHRRESFGQPGECYHLVGTFLGGPPLPPSPPRPSYSGPDLQRPPPRHPRGGGGA